MDSKDFVCIKIKAVDYASAELRRLARWFLPSLGITANTRLMVKW